MDIALGKRLNALAFLEHNTRREALDHVLIAGEADARRALAASTTPP
ncbi:hypothetical protein [Saccharothrix sp. ST-888]|nr:hypothetical protein [Saccharothrix sp. ST-888]